MKKNQIFGLAAIALGVLFIIASVVPVGSMDLYITRANFNIFDLIEGGAGAPSLWVPTGVFGLLTMIAAIGLVIYGVAIMLDKWNGKLLGKTFTITMIVVSALALLAGLLGILLASTGDWSAVLSVSAAPIMWLIFGIVGIASAFVTPMIARNKD